MKTDEVSDEQFQEDNIDARVPRPIDSYASWRVKEASQDTHIDNDRYNINRGHCIILNNKVFNGMKERQGTDYDKENLELRFQELNFDVVAYQDPSVRDIRRIIYETSKRDFSNDDCFVCCVLSHGDEGGLYGSDGKYNKETLFAPFKGDACPSLAGKPKIFFIQACHGDKVDSGVNLVQRRGADYVTDSVPVPVVKISKEADFLIAYSSVPGFYSWNNSASGSCFIQALCSVLEKEGSTSHLLNILTRVNRLVAYDFESNVPMDPMMHQKKQVPYITYTLTKKVFFPRKESYDEFVEK